MASIPNKKMRGRTILVAALLIIVGAAGGGRIL